jgi:electron transfer flavoprotein alpha subunit
VSDIRRIDPRRPYRFSATGVRRIVLGEASPAGDVAPSGGTAAATQRKPLRTRTAPASWHMAIAYTNRGRLDDHARQAIAAAAILATPDTGVLAVVLGALNEPRAELGADVVGVFPDRGNDTFAPERDLALISALIANYQPRHIFLADAADGTGDIGRRLVARHQLTSAVRAVELSKTRATIAMSSGAELATAPLPAVVLLAPGAVDPDLPFEGAADPIPAFAPQDVAEAISDLGLEAQDPTGTPLEEADFIISAGKGVVNTATLKALAEDFGAAVGASRVAVDEGKFARHQQIGATGKTVSATTYIAVGISGAVQHLQGIKDCRHVIAINRDGGAPIIGRADLSVVGDAEAIMQALLELKATLRHNSNPPGAAQ